MIRNNIRMSWFRRNRRIVYLTSGAVCVLVVSFFITVGALSKNNEETNFAKNNIVNMNEDRQIELVETRDSSIRTIEIKEDEPKKEEVEKVETKKKAEIKTVPVTAIPEKKKISFVMPLEGEIINEFANEKLIYSKTLEEWITHNGIDIKGEEAMPVKVVADGIIKSIKVDPRYGNTIIVEHDEGYISIYSNLSTTELVTLKQEVKQGDIISGVGKGYGFELEDGPHIHIEVKKDGKYVSLQDLI